MIACAYILIGFLVASLLYRFVDFDLDSDGGDVVLFLILGAIWPAIVGGFILVVPFKILFVWTQLLQRK